MILELSILLCSVVKRNILLTTYDHWCGELATKHARTDSILMCEENICVFNRVDDCITSDRNLALKEDETNDFAQHQVIQLVHQVGMSLYKPEMNDKFLILL